MKTIILYGLRRSGNHFLISTILQQFSNYVHINDANLSYNNYNKYKNTKKNRERSDRNWIGFKDVECVVISLENKKIDSNEIDKFKKISNCYFLILIRCPYSHFSSVWKVYNKNKGQLQTIIKLWKMYAKYFINNNNNNEFIKIIYDEFSSNESYMVNIMQKLCIDNINIDKDKQIPFQRSSFGSDSEKKCQIYTTLESCIYKDDSAFLKLVKDKEINNLWEIIKKQTF